MSLNADGARVRAAGLGCWSTLVDPQPISGGITNANFVVRDRGQSFFVRIGDDIPVHGVLRWSELAASRAAHAAGISPEVIHAEPGALVLRFIDGRTLQPADVRDPAMLERIVDLIRRCHRDVPQHLRGPTLMFWAFQVLRDYTATLRAAHSRLTEELPKMLAIAAELETAVGPVEIVFGHNDLLAGNLIDDGERLWLVDWDYAGFNSPLFDLGGLASNNELSTDQERWLLEAYFARALTDELWRRYSAMKCASLLREAMWSMVSEIHSSVAFDYVAYTMENLQRFERAYDAFRTM